MKDFGDDLFTDDLFAEDSHDCGFDRQFNDLMKAILSPIGQPEKSNLKWWKEVDGTVSVEVPGWSKDQLSTEIKDDNLICKFEGNGREVSFAVGLPKRTTTVKVAVEHGICKVQFVERPCPINIEVE